MERYAYLLLGLLVAVPLFPIILYRRDIAEKTLKVGLFGGVAGLLAELFYFRDYWRPPSLAGMATISMEDFIFGFAITALSFAVYPALFNYSFVKREYPSRLQLYAAFFALGFASMLILNISLGINSIFVSSVVFIVLSAVILLLRRDLWRSALYSVLPLTGLIILIYLVVFNLIAPEFWSKYWLLADTRWGVTILGNVPLTEILWYASWILFASISYPFVSGKPLSRKNPRRDSQIQK